MFRDDIKYLLSMEALWKKRRPPTPLDWNNLPNTGKVAVVITQVFREAILSLVITQVHRVAIVITQVYKVAIVITGI